MVVATVLVDVQEFVSTTGHGFTTARMLQIGPEQECQRLFKRATIAEVGRPNPLCFWKYDLCDTKVVLYRYLIEATL